jgi:hypothetical protein
MKQSHFNFQLVVGHYTSTIGTHDAPTDVAPVTLAVAGLFTPTGITIAVK